MQVQYKPAKSSTPNACDTHSTHASQAPKLCVYMSLQADMSVASLTRVAASY